MKEVAQLLTNLKTLLTVVLATSKVGALLGVNDGWVEGISEGLKAGLKIFSLCDLPNIGSNGSTRSELNGSSLSDLKCSSFRDFPKIGSNGLSELSESALAEEVGSDIGIVCRRPPPNTSCL